MTEPAATLADLRARLADLDRELLAVAARRQELAAAIGALKAHGTEALRDAAQEREVLARARRVADELGAGAALGEELLQVLLRHSLAVQEQLRLAGRGDGEGRRALVIGGAGRMGAWFARFLRRQGWQVAIADPVAPPPDLADCEWVPDAAARPLDEALIVVAATLRVSAEVLHDLARRRPAGVVFDIGSLKAPLRDGLEACRAAGVSVASVHPMFGPAVDLLAGRHVVVVDLGCPAATALAGALFAGTTARVVTMDLAGHDRAMAFVLGLSHAVNIAFAAALPRSGAAAADLAGLSSTTFEAQLGVAARVVAENPHLYFEIQQLNEHGPAALEALAGAVTRLRDAVRDGDAGAFVALMEEGQRYLHARAQQAPG